MKEDQLPKAKYSGELDLNGFTLSCSVLEDGTRVFSERSLANAFGIKGGGAYWQKKKNNEGAYLPEYLSAKYLKPYISNDLTEKLGGAFQYVAINGTIANGYDAAVLPEICDVYVTALNSGVKNENLKKVADTAYLMIKGFAKVGIIALIDEATGYQYDREKDELQKILKVYVAEELRDWVKTFPDIYYKEIFRLNKWDYTVMDIKKRPGVVGKWTNAIIYKQLPKGVLEELKKSTPKSEQGNYTARFFQKLTGDIGNSHLQQQLNSVITLMQVSDNWQDFISKFNKLVDRRNGQLELKFEDLEYKGEPKTIEKTKFNDTLGALMKVPKPD